MGVYVKSYGLVKLGRLYGKGLEDLIFDAVDQLDKPGIKPDMIIVSSLFSGSVSGQLDLSSKIAGLLGYRNVPSIRVETGETSGHSAVYTAFKLLASGLFDDILVIGADKITEFVSAKSYKEISKIHDSAFEAYFGVGHASLHAIAMKEYMKRYGKSHEELAYWPALMHKNAADNPYAALRFPVDPESVVKSTVISDPITLLDSYPLVDGAAALYLSRNPNSPLAEILYSCGSTDVMPVTHKEDILDIPSARRVYERIREESVEPVTPDIIEVTDQFTISPYLILEATGISPRGMAVDLANEGRYDRDGETPANITGGLKARGHPFGATGLYQVAEMAGVLSGTFPVSIPEAKSALVLGVNGLGSNSYGILLGRGG